MNYDFDRIADELKHTPQWVVWKAEERKGKSTKVPYQINGRLAQSNNPETWSHFDDTINIFYQGGYDGIGFMFSENDPFVGIDIDKCFDEGELSETARDIVDLMKSYTEVSPSGKGIHIIVEGKLPIEITGTGKKNPDLGLEVYRHGRYFTFTGATLNNNPIEERTEKIASLFDKYLKKKEMKKAAKSIAKNDRPSIDSLSSGEMWTRMFSAKNGSSIKDLFDGCLINDDHSSTDLALCNHLAFWTDKDASKMDSMFRETSLLREKWDTQHSSDGRTYGQMTIDEAINSTSSTIDDYYEDKGKPYEIYISDEDKEVEVEEDEFDEKTPFFRLSELGNAERLVYYHGKDIRFSGEIGWLMWNGKYWDADSKMAIESIAAKTFRSLYKESKKAKEDENKALAKQTYEWAQKCERRSIRMSSILDTRPMVSVVKAELDNHSFLFNCSNGVLDLKKGKLLPHNRDLLLTKIANVTYDPTAKCPSWLKFLDSIFEDQEGKEEIIEFLQKAIGYTLTGDISEQVIFFLYGTGRNGKSTFINTVQALLGDYGRQTNSETFIKKKNDNGINNDIARLDGARFVSAVESEEGQQLAESLVKQITGGEKMSARFLRQEFFEFKPEFKVFFTTNHKPIIKGSDEGIWRRMRLVPFTVKIPIEKIDKNLPEKLAAEMPGIFNWALEGFAKWQKDGLGEPDVIKQATQGYRADMDIIAPFLDEVCIVNPLAKVEAKSLYQEYKVWCYANGEMELKNRTFYRQLETKGYKKERGNLNKNYFHGIGIAKENDDLKEENNSLINNSNIDNVKRFKI